MGVSLRLLGFARPQRGLLTIMVLLGLLVAGLNVGQALLLANALGAILQGQPLAQVALPLFGAAVLLLARAAATGWSEVLGVEVATRIKGLLRTQLYAKLLALGPGWTGRTRSGLVQTVLVDSVETVQNYYSLLIPRVIVSIFTALLLPALVVALDPLVGAVISACALIALAAPLISTHLLYTQTLFWREQYFPLNAEYLDSVQGMATLKSFNASRRRADELRERAWGVRDASVGLVTRETFYTGAVGLAIAVGTAFSVALGALHVANGTLDGRTLLLILLLVGQCFAPVRALQTAFHYAFYIPAIAERIFAVLDAEPIVEEVTAPRPAATLAPSIRFEQVSFAYHPNDRPALHAVSFNVAQGQSLALVGRSGAGKTTVVSLLLRFFDPQAGTITIGGRDVRTLPLAELRAQIALVSQDVYLFHGTIRENLLFARPDASEAQLLEATGAAAVHDFVAALPNGYETVVGERGLKLSGGERQRIAIARALLKDAPILILDEATSSIDLANEALIQQALDRVMVGRTTLIIAHRLSTVRGADQIVVLDEGRVAEQGKPTALVQTQGAYARMLALQGGTA